MPTAVAIIPARFESTRFPGKPLALLKGKPIIQYVYEQAVQAVLIESVFVATDDKRIYDTVTGFGGSAVMTSPGHASGTDRVAEVAKGIECDFVINIQGDEPFIRPQMIDDVVNLLLSDDRVSIATLAKRIIDIKEILSPDVVKVVSDNEGFAMYFSRAPIPYYRDEWEFQSTEQSPPCFLVETRKGERTQSTDFKNTFKIQTLNSELRTFHCYKHIGIYGYRKEVLLRFASMKQGKLELIEKLEQLRALASGIKIKVKETKYDTFGIDTIEDLRKAEEWLNISS